MVTLEEAEVAVDGGLEHVLVGVRGFGSGGHGSGDGKDDAGVSWKLEVVGAASSFASLRQEGRGCRSTPLDPPPPLRSEHCGVAMRELDGEADDAEVSWGSSLEAGDGGSAASLGGKGCGAGGGAAVRRALEGREASGRLGSLGMPGWERSGRKRAPADGKRDGDEFLN